jgi:hypothetical protein
MSQISVNPSREYTVAGVDLSDEAVKAAVAEAGYEVV